jgi:hypothetical protein
MEYVLFLQNAAQPISPRAGSASRYGTIDCAEVFDEGYTSMETSFQCAFRGQAINQQCDYGVRVCTDYITLPKSMTVSPPMTDETPFGCRGVRKQDFLLLLRSHHDSKK